MTRVRPATVTLSGLLLFAGAVLGVVSAAVLFAAPGAVVASFRGNAKLAGASPADIDAVAGMIDAVFVASGAVTLCLALAAGALAPGVLRGSKRARVATFVLVGAALWCGLGTASYTVLGRNATWTMNLDHPSEQLVAQVADAYADAMPGVLVGANGGLTDLQALGYIAVTVLLLVPASNAYFRRPRRGLTPGR